MKNNKFKLTSKMLKNTLTFSAVVLTLSGPVLPLAAQAVETNEGITTDSNTEAVANSTVEKMEESITIPDESIEQVNEQITTEENSVTEVAEKSEVQPLAGTVAEVSNWTQFRQAITDANIEEIKLKTDITVGSSLTTAGLKKSIDANNHTIEMNNNNITGLDGGVYQLSNANLLGTTTSGGPFSASWNYANYEVTYENVTQKGKALIKADKGKIILKGNIDSDVISGGTSSIKAGSLDITEGTNAKFLNNGVPSSQYEGALNVSKYSVGKFEIRKNANVEVTTSHMESIRVGSKSTMNVNGTLNVNSDKYGAINLETDTRLNVNAPLTIFTLGQVVSGGSLELLENAEMKSTSYGDGYSAGISVSTFKARNGSSIEALSINNKAPVIAVSSRELGAFIVSENANIDIHSKALRPVLGSPDSGSYTVFRYFEINSKNGIQTWPVGATENSDDATFYPGPFDSSFMLSGMTTSNESNNRSGQKSLSSNNTDFRSDFVALGTGRIATGKFATNPNYKEPTLEAPERIEIEKGSSFDPLKVSGLKATDYQGNDITSSITSSGVVDTNKPGEYTVVYSVTDSTGKTVTKTMIVVVKDTATIKQTTINGLTTDSTQAVGTAEPNSTIVIKVDGKEIATGKVGSDGKYSLTIPKQKAGAQVTATATANGKESSATTTVTQGTSETQGVITPSEYTIGDANIVGTYTGDVLKARVTINGKEQAWGGSFNNGKFTYYVGAGKIKAGDVVTITAYDKNDKVLDANKPVKIKAAATQGTITPAEYTIGDTEITGTYTGDVSKARVTINGKPQAWGGSFNNGKFTYYIGNGKIKAGDVVTITAYDKEDKVLDADKPVTIKKVTAGTINPAEYTIGDTEITGTYTGDVTKARVTINGKPQAWGGSFNNGKFTYYVGAGKIKAGDVVTITAYDKEEKVLDANKPVTITKVSEGTISPVEYTIGDTEITGTYTGDVTKARVTINGKPQAWGGSFNNGKFTYYIGTGKIKAGDVVTITAYDKNEKVLDANKVVKIKELVQVTLSPDAYNVGETTIKGTYTGDIVRARLLINGTPQAWGGTFSGGSFSYYIGAGKIKAGDNVKIVGYSADNSELATQVVTVTP